MDIEGFWSRVEKTDGCWVWHGNVTKRGYGLVTIEKRRFAVHRYSYELANGPIPTGMLVCHRCDNPSCVNPAHLFLGTDADNLADKLQKNRQAKGGAINTCKLTPDAVRSIRGLSASGVQKAKIARRFGVSDRQVGAIVRRECWRHVE